MPRYAIKQSVLNDWCNLAGVDRSVYTVEMSYQTNINTLFGTMSKGSIVLPEWSTIPDLRTVDQVVINALREGKRELDLGTPKSAADYIDTNIVLPDRPAKPTSVPRPLT